VSDLYEGSRSLPLLVTWVEPATGNTVTQIEDYENNVAWTNNTDLASKEFWRLKGAIRPANQEGQDT